VRLLVELGKGPARTWAGNLLRIRDLRFDETLGTSTTQGNGSKKIVGDSWHANHADSDLPTFAVEIFLTLVLRQFFGLETLRQNYKFETLVFEQKPSHRCFHSGCFHSGFQTLSLALNCTLEVLNFSVSSAQVKHVLDCHGLARDSAISSVGKRPSVD
jgi:hypothetical protein